MAQSIPLMCCHLCVHRTTTTMLISLTGTQNRNLPQEGHFTYYNNYSVFTWSQMCMAKISMMKPVDGYFPCFLNHLS